MCLGPAPEGMVSQMSSTVQGKQHRSPTCALTHPGHGDSDHGHSQATGPSPTAGSQDVPKRLKDFGTQLVVVFSSLFHPARPEPRAFLTLRCRGPGLQGCDHR